MMDFATKYKTLSLVLHHCDHVFTFYALRWRRSRTLCVSFDASCCTLAVYHNYLQWIDSNNMVTKAMVTDSVAHTRVWLPTVTNLFITLDDVHSVVSSTEVGHSIDLSQFVVMFVVVGDVRGTLCDTFMCQLSCIFYISVFSGHAPTPA